jgi:hypothetical protein
MLLQKLPVENNGLRGENTPNLVTLTPANVSCMVACACSKIFSSPMSATYNINCKIAGLCRQDFSGSQRNG